MNMNDFPNGMKKEDKVFKLTIQLQNVKQRKKEEAAAFRDEIKDIESEIAALTAEENLEK